MSAKLLDSFPTDEPIKVGDAKNLNRLSSDLLEFSGDLYKALIKKYFIELNSSDFEAPDRWEKKEFGELFVERKIRVGTLGYCPSQYSVTNNGIQLREGKFSKELSANTSSYKVAFEGDMVFGLSREIPNLDVFQDKQGAFSGAYHIFAPKDVRVGLLIGSVMRLKLLEQTDILKGGAREGRGLDKDKLLQKTFLIPSNEILDSLWGVSW